MKAALALRNRPRGTRLAVVGAALGFFWGCSTTELRPEPIPAAQPPEYVKVPQPAGFDLGDVQALFVDSSALGEETIKSCDGDFRKLRELTQSEDELRRGATELVKQDPVFYHWCFYGKILEIESALKEMAYVDERQKKVIDTYSFLVPVARGFLSQYNDSRYLRWAIRHYRHLSTIVFYQKLNQTPEMTAQLVEVANPFGLYREPVKSGSVLEKYHLVRKQPDKKAVAEAGGVAPPTVSNSDLTKGEAAKGEAGMGDADKSGETEPATPHALAPAGTSPEQEPSTAGQVSAPHTAEVASESKPLFPPADSDEPLVPPGINPADAATRAPASDASGAESAPSAAGKPPAAGAPLTP